jgi:hypothetical protein
MSKWRKSPRRLHVIGWVKASWTFGALKTHSSRAARHARTFHRFPDRTLRRQFPALARAGTGPRPDAQCRRQSHRLRQRHRATTPRRRSPRDQRPRPRTDQSQDRGCRISESPHHARHRRPRCGSGKRERPFAWEGQCGCEGEGGNDCRDFDEHQRAAGVILFQSKKPAVFCLRAFFYFN